MKIKVFETNCSQNKYFSEKSYTYGDGAQNGEACAINVYDDLEYQEILGFGGAFTETAAYNYSLLSDDAKKDFLEKNFDEKNGIGYNFGRTHINSCDFSLDIYCNVKENDKTLETFDISRDRKYIIPFLKDAIKYCKNEIVLLASPWSPPAYMKDNASPVKGGSLLDDYKAVWALYYTKYIKAYKQEGINISAISIQNEPNARQTWESCYYSDEDEREFLVDYLIPTLDKEGLGDIKIIIWDHNKERVYDRAKSIFSDATARERVWAVGHHWYSGDHFGAMTLVHEKFNKPCICTEFCGGMDGDPLTLAERYAREMCENFNNYTIASCDWNLLVDDEGGPFHNRTGQAVVAQGVVIEKKTDGCYAPVIYDRKKKELIYTPIYYYIGHFSKFVKRGAKRIATTKFSDSVSTCAFRNPDGTIVCVVLNRADTATKLNFRHNAVLTEIPLQAHSIITVVIE